MSQKTDTGLLQDIAASFVAGVTKWTGLGLQQRLADLVDSKVNKSDMTSGQAFIQLGLKTVIIGQGAVGTPASGSYDAFTMGPEASTAYEAGGFANDSDGPEKMAIGFKAKAPQWRGHAIGAYAYAAAVSALSIGPKSWCDYSHGVVVGRGAMMPEMPGAIEYGNVFGGEQTNHMGVGNWWGHRFPDHPLSMDAVAADIIPENITKVYHGQNAYDAKDGTSVNVNGGHARLQAGLPTGSGLPGRVELAAASQFASSLGGNVQKSPVVYLVVDGIDSNPDELGLQLRVAGNLKRVSIGAANSAGTGFRTLRVPN